MNIEIKKTSLMNFSLLLLIAAACVFIVERDMVANGFSVLPGDRVDAVISAAILEHWFNVFKGNSNWLDVGYFYPYTRTIAQTDAYFLIGLLYAPFRFMGFDPFLSQEFASNIVLRVLGFLGAYFLARKTGMSFWYAALVASLFALANVITSHSSRDQLASVAFAPYLMLCLFKTGQGVISLNKNKILIWGAAAGVIYGALCLTCFYISWFFLFVFLLYFFSVIVFLGKEERRKIVQNVRSCWPQLLCVVFISALALIPFGYAFFFKAQEVGVRGYDEAKNWIHPFWILLDMGPSNFMFGGIYHEFLSYVSPQYKPQDEYANMGYSFLMMAFFFIGLCKEIFAKKTDRNPYWIALGVSALLGILFTLEFHTYSLWFFVYKYIPGSKALRVVSIIHFVTFLPIVLLAIKYLSEIKISRPMFVVLSVILLMGEINKPYMALNRSAEMERISLTKMPPEQCKVFYVSGWEWQKKIDPKNLGDEIFPHNVTAIMISQFAHIPTINGFASFNPKDWDFAFPYNGSYEKRIETYIKNHKLTGVCKYDLDAKEWSAANF
jgi:hypothetical protein